MVSLSPFGVLCLHWTQSMGWRNGCISLWKCGVEMPSLQNTLLSWTKKKCISRVFFICTALFVRTRSDSILPIWPKVCKNLTITPICDSSLKLLPQLYGMSLYAALACSVTPKLRDPCMKKQSLQRQVWCGRTPVCCTKSWTQHHWTYLDNLDCQFPLLMHL